MIPATQIAEAAWISFYVVAALGSASHALLHKRDPRSAWGWIAVCWLFPLVGAALYWLFGVNRVAQYAFAAPEAMPRRNGGADEANGALDHHDLSPAQRELAHAGAIASGNQLAGGNQLEPLINGDEAYPAMLAAIEAAQESIYLATYIYCADETGRRFAEALARAQRRGVRVRVLLDGVSDLFYRPRASRMLAAHGLPHALFLPLRLWPLRLHINLRNHRKLLLVDGEIAFTGGMNVAAYHRLKGHARNPVADLQFRIRGPLLAQLHAVFRADWKYAAGESLPANSSTPRTSGTAFCRVVTDGPDNQRDPFMLLLIAALASAHRRVRIMTPYFAPPAPIAAALEATAMRGVDVAILLPGCSDQPWIDWATRHAMAPLLSNHVRVYFGPAPFAHTKLLMIDDDYVQLGSGNLDVRSLRLNFELNVEAYDHWLAAALHHYFDEQVRAARAATLDELSARHLPERLRDAFCWLFSPYM